MSKNVQLPMFDPDTERRMIRREKKRTRKSWYYITRWRNSEMLFAFADDGTPLWCEHDSRGLDGILPYLFDKKSQAQREARLLDHPVTIRQWHYSIGMVKKGK